MAVFSCDEEEIPKNTSSSFVIPELGKPIQIDHRSFEEMSFVDTYHGMDLNFYVPPGIEELENRPLLFTISTMRNSSVSGSLLTVVKKYRMIAVSPKNGNELQFEAFVNSMIATSYIDSTRVYMAGFSNGGRDVSSLAWIMQNKVEGVVLLDPTAVSVGDRVENSKLSVCIVCQEERVSEYGSSVSRLNGIGVNSKIIGVEGTDHFGILSPVTEQEKNKCFEFVRTSE